MVELEGRPAWRDVAVVLAATGTAAGVMRTASHLTSVLAPGTLPPGPRGVAAWLSLADAGAWLGISLACGLAVPIGLARDRIPDRGLVALLVSAALTFVLSAYLAVSSLLRSSASWAPLETAMELFTALSGDATALQIGWLAWHARKAQAGYPRAGATSLKAGALGVALVAAAPGPVFAALVAVQGATSREWGLGVWCLLVGTWCIGLGLLPALVGSDRSRPQRLGIALILFGAVVAGPIGGGLWANEMRSRSFWRSLQLASYMLPATSCVAAAILWRWRLRAAGALRRSVEPDRRPPEPPAPPSHGGGPRA